MVSISQRSKVELTPVGATVGISCLQRSVIFSLDKIHYQE
jgi:hypothetical protein